MNNTPPRTICTPITDLQNQVSKKQRITWLDGLRGISCVLIFLHHFLLQYYPASYFGSISESHAHGIDTLLAQSPLGVFVNGNFFVFIFIFVSGYSIGLQTLRIDSKMIGTNVLKRYLKLMIPILVNETIMFILFRLGFLQYLKVNIGESPCYWIVIKSAMIRTLFWGDQTLVGSYWMMNYIFIGGIFITITASLTWTIGNRKTFIISFLLAIALLTQGMVYHSIIFCGLTLCLFHSIYNFEHKRKLSFFLLFSLGLFLGGFPSGTMPENIYKCLILPFAGKLSFYYWHLFGAILTVSAIFYLPILQNLLNYKVFQKLGVISYVFYVFHTSCTQAFNPFHELLFQYIHKYYLASILDLTLIFLTLLFISSFYVKYIQKKTNSFINKI